MQNLPLVSLGLILSQAIWSGGCQSPDIRIAGSSEVSTIRIGELGGFAGEGKPKYEKLSIAIKGAESTTFEQKLEFAADNGEQVDTKFKLPRPAKYTFVLSYLDAAGKVLFESCNGQNDQDGKATKVEKTRVHVIDTPEYAFEVSICDLRAPIEGGTGASANLPLPPPPPPPPLDSDVSIKPIATARGGSAQPGAIVGAGAQDLRSGKLFVDSNSLAAAAAKDLRQQNNPDVKYVDYIARQSTATWLVSRDAQAQVRDITTRASQQGAYSLFVAYMIPNRDCGQYSAGGLSAGDYAAYIDGIAQGVGNRKAIVILEPDALAAIGSVENGKGCLSPEQANERIQLLKNAVERLKRQPDLKVYIDAGHAAWMSSDEAAKRLLLAGVDKADGFILNVSNYQPLESNTKYGREILAKIGAKGFLIDTSRNAPIATASTEWCNPSGRGLGREPTLTSGIVGVDGLVWAKRPGESDGTCNGGPNAGEWSNKLAIELAKNAVIKL